VPPVISINALIDLSLSVHRRRVETEANHGQWVYFATSADAIRTVLIHAGQSTETVRRSSFGIKEAATAFGAA
jgi:hypothetical protein